jgi:hypothetical protein
MRYTVFSNTKEGRTMVDTWTTEDNKTMADIVRIYDDEYAKVDVYTDEDTFVRSVYLSPDGTDTLITPAEGTILVAALEGYIQTVGA